MKFILALDQGTTSSRSIVFDHDGHIHASAQQEFKQHYPQPGWVEHDPEEIWNSQLATAREALQKAKLTARDIAAIGITNQRETVVLWDRKTGKPVYNAIVWQDRRTASICDEIRKSSWVKELLERTGLVPDPYFSGTKIKWLLHNVPDLRHRAQQGDIVFGTVDSWLLWKLTGGKVHATDCSNASRTLLFNIHALEWDRDLLSHLGIPAALLPEVRPSSGIFGVTSPEWFGAEIPIAGMAGDQQAALFGQACFKPGTLKNTYGTGCFMLMQTGEQIFHSKNGLLTTIAWQVGNEKVQYALEGAVFIAGAVVQWLRDGLGIIQSASEIESLAASVPDTGGVAIVPALVGLGAPHWRPEARGLICGISRGTTAAHIARAALEAMAMQNVDLVRAMERDAGQPITSLRVDGGATSNGLLMQMQADLLGTDILRPAMIESTALGAGMLAARGLGLESRQTSKPNLNITVFHPRVTPAEREQRMLRWRDALARS
jgi:glycerol kinase